MTSVCLVVQNDYEFDVRVRRKAEALVAAGYYVDVLALRSARTTKTYALNGVNVRTVSLRKKRASVARYMFEYVTFLVWAFLRVSIQMPWRRYAVIDVNTLPDFLIFAGALARRMGAKLLLDMHEITPEFFISKYDTPDRSIVVGLLKRIEKCSFDFADRVITINAPIEQLLATRGLPLSKSTVIMNAADETRFERRPAAGGADIRTASAATFVMMYHGTLTGIYGVESAVEAFSIVHEEMPGAEFWILGDGPEKASLERRTAELGIASKVRLLGWRPPDEVPAWLTRCDVGVLPMRRDVFLDYAFPNKLSEYIIMSKPVIVPRLSAIRHYFSEDAMLYCEPNNSQDLARQMVRAYRDRGAHAERAARARDEYTPIRWELMKERYLRLIEELCGRGSRTLSPARSAEVTATAPR